MFMAQRHGHNLVARLFYHEVRQEVHNLFCSLRRPSLSRFSSAVYFKTTERSLVDICIILRPLTDLTEFDSSNMIHLGGHTLQPPVRRTGLSFIIQVKYFIVFRMYSGV